ncbi:MAG: hypothetical protein ACPL0B_03465 [Anaerolineales bacterium]
MVIKPGKVSSILILTGIGMIISLSACENFPTPLSTEISTTTPISENNPSPTKIPTSISSAPITPTSTVEPLPSITDTSLPQATPSTNSTATSLMTNSAIAEPLVYPQSGSPKYLVNYLHPELGCDWLGVVGQIFDMNSKPVIGKIIEVDGNINGMEILGLGLSGNAPPIGPAGYEIKLNDTPIDSNPPLRIQVFNSDGTPLSNPIPFYTYKDCNKNLIVFNFLIFPQPLINQEFLPLIGR